jgi:hypothetical protein
VNWRWHGLDRRIAASAQPRRDHPHPGFRHRVVRVRRPAVSLLRQNGLPAIAMAIAPRPGENVVHVGRAIDARLAELTAELPIGIGVERISWQSDSVSESIKAFITNLLQAVVIVFVVVAVTMGLRVGLIIGISGLIFPILGSFIVMWMIHIDLQRVSLGALIIAMGMMVDNAIVVVDGIVVRLGQGMDRKRAAIEAASQPAIALLGATVVACMAFYPIFASTYSTGNMRAVCSRSWRSRCCSAGSSARRSPRYWRSAGCPRPSRARSRPIPIKRRFSSVSAVCCVGHPAGGSRFWADWWCCWSCQATAFRFVPQLFFPDSSRRQIMIDYWAPEGTRIQQVSQDLERIEQLLKEQPTVASVSTFIGQGPPRFYLPVAPEDPNPCYAQIVVNTHTLRDVDALIAMLDPWMLENVPEAMVRVRKYAVGAFDDWKFEARFSGPAVADPDDLRTGRAGHGHPARSPAGQRSADRLAATGQETGSELQSRTRPLGRCHPRESGASHAPRLRRHPGRPVPRAGRSDPDPVPQRRGGTALRRRVARSDPSRPGSVVQHRPVSQVVDGIDQQWEDPVIRRRDRRRAITVQCSPDGVTTPTLRASVVAAFEAIPLPPGYRMDWDGEHRSSSDSQEALIPGIVPALVIMVLILVVLFNAYRPPLIIFLVIPFVMIGITFGLLITRVPFGFIALLGAMSLSGMMIKNAVVLLDQVNLNLAEGMKPDGRRGRSRRLAIAAGRQRRGHHGAGHAAAVARRVLGFHVRHHHVRPGPGNHPDHGRRPRPVRPAVPHP